MANCTACKKAVRDHAISPKVSSKFWRRYAPKMSNVFAAIAIVVSLFTLWWSRRTEREVRRRDAVIDSMVRFISNSKKLTHESRKGLERLANSPSNAPLRDVAMREQSDAYRHEVGAERVIITAFGGRDVSDAVEQIYQAHRTIRRAIWHDKSPPDREAAWAEIARWGAKPPSEQIYDRFETLHTALIEAIRTDTSMNASS